jgi:hypothetical protein
LQLAPFLGMKRSLIILVLVAAVAAAGFYLYSYWTHRTPAGTPGTPPGILSQVPQDAPVILYCDLAALRLSAFYAQLTALAPAPGMDQEYADFVRSTGFDYTRDLDRVAVAAWPSPQPPALVAVAEGRFDRDKITRYAARSGTVSKKGGMETYEVATANPPRRIVFAFLGSNRIAIAEGKDFETVLQAARSAHFYPEMSARIASVAGSPVFGAARTDDLPKDLALEGFHSDQLNRLLRSVRGLTLAGQPEGQRLKVALDADCDSATNAFQLSTLLDALRWLGRAGLADPKARTGLQPQEAQVLDSVLRAAQISHESNRVRLRLELTPEMLAPAAKARPSGPKHQ